MIVGLFSFRFLIFFCLNEKIFLYFFIFTFASLEAYIVNVDRKDKDCIDNKHVNTTQIVEYCW